MEGGREARNRTVNVQTPTLISLPFPLPWSGCSRFQSPVSRHGGDDTFLVWIAGLSVCGHRHKDTHLRARVIRLQPSCSLLGSDNSDEIGVCIGTCVATSGENGQRGDPGNLRECESGVDACSRRCVLGRQEKRMPSLGCGRQGWHVS